MSKRCELCLEILGEEDNIVKEIQYRDPYDEEGREIELHEGCQELWEEEQQFWCNYCCRFLPEDDGGMKYYRIVEVGEGVGEMKCLKCYEEDILENGMSEKEFKKGTIPGMFGLDVESYGYMSVKDYNNILVNRKKVEDLSNKALELMDEGYKVVCVYESLSVIGEEGYVSLYVK